MRRSRVAVAAVSAAFLLLAIAAYFVLRGPQGASSPEVAVADYIAALIDDDRGGLEDLAHPDYDSEAAITEKLRLYGGSPLQVAEETIVNYGEASHMKTATLKGTV